MPRPVEFEPRRQGRPPIIPTIELETGRGAVYSTIVFLEEENMKLSETVDRLMNEGLVKSEKMLEELKQIKLHLASMSDAHVDEESIREDS